MKKIIWILFLFMSETVFAKTAHKLTPIISSGEIVKLCLSLLSVVLLVLVFSYLFRKMNNVSFGGSGAMSIVSSLSVGPKEKIVLLDVEGENLLIGVTSGGISLLKTVKNIEVKKVKKTKDVLFVDSFKKFLKKGT